MSDVVHRGLTEEDIDNLIVFAVDDCDLWGLFNNDESEFDKHIQRVHDARDEIRELEEDEDGYESDSVDD